MTDKRTAINLLRDNGFELVRSKKHQVYKDDAGRTMVLPSTPSDIRAYRNAIADMRRLHGIEPEVYRPTARVRNPRPVPAQPAPFPIEAIASTRPLTSDEEALLAKWQKAEEKRIDKDNRLLNRWEQEELRARRDFREWLQIRANMIGTTFWNLLVKCSEEQISATFQVGPRLLEVLNAGLSRGYIVDGDIHAVERISHYKVGAYPARTELTELLEVRRVAGEPTWFMDGHYGTIWQGDITNVQMKNGWRVVCDYTYQETLCGTSAKA